MSGPVTRRLYGTRIRTPRAHLCVHLRVTGPRGTEFDSWTFGLRVFYVFFFVQRLAWGTLRCVLESDGKVRFSKRLPWPRAHRPQHKEFLK